MPSSAPRVPLPSRAIAIAAAFRHGSDGIAALEFAVLMPVLTLFMLAGGELARYVNVSRAVTNLANSLDTQLAERTTNLDYNSAIYTFNSTMVTFPFVLKDAATKGLPWQYDIAVTLSSITFSPTVPGCTSGCSYNAKVGWSLNSPTATARSCKTPPTAAADTATPSTTTLPQDVFTSGSIVVADVVYQYTPTFGSRFVPPITLRRSVYLQPRYLATVGYSVAGTDAIKPCTSS